MIKILSYPAKMLALIFGRISWFSPPWLQRLNAIRKAKPVIFWGLCSAVLLAAIAYQYYKTLPKPIMVKANFQPLEITQNHKNAKPDILNIYFDYDFSTLTGDQQHPQGSPSVARIDLVGEKITKGITLSPAKKGSWTWLDDRSIQFEPESDWPAGTPYTLVFDKSIFSAETKLSEDSYEFTTPKFNIAFSNIEFYQDPQDITVRRVISTLQFTHPVDKASFEEKLSMHMRPSGSTMDKEAKAYKFAVSYDDNQREAYIQSEPVALPTEPNYMRVAVAAKVKTILGGAATSVTSEEKILVPDIYSFLKVNIAQTHIVHNQKNEPEQLLMLEFTDDIDKAELLDKLSVYLLPKKGEPGGKNYWRAPGEVSELTLKNSKKVNIKLVPNERSFSKLYSFVFDVPENSYLYVKIAPQLTSVNKFVHSSRYSTVLKSPKYPKEIDIAGDGSVLTYSGDHKLSILSRGVPALKYSIGKLLDGQLNHLITQTNGDLSNPAFSNWSFNSNNVAEFYNEIVDVESTHPKIANYSSLDLTRFLPQSGSRFGLFFIDVKGWNKSKKHQIHDTSDKRLILVTDLGIIVKNNADKTHDIFVQSIQTGLPVAGASVELLGKNGIALYKKTTSADGHVAFPPTRDFENEKQPSVYVVKTNTDISFIPFDRRSRQINLSKFDIGGVSTSSYQKDSLNAYLFSDRGIYRPGEEINIGFIVKNTDLSNIEGIPLEIVVRSPRNNEIKVKKIVLPEKGFFDFQYLTDTTSSTGRYRASLHLVRDNKYRGREIGAINFKVEEFQPDTMKIESKLIDTKEKGWNNKEKIDVKVSLRNLFGIPAQDRKVNGQIIIKPANFSFNKLKNYKFTDPFYDKNKKPLSLNEMLEAQNTDADGLANFEIDLQRFREGTYSLEFIAEGFDQAGGRSVTAYNTALISPLHHLVGYKPDGKLDYINANSKRVIEFIAIDTTLNKVNKSDLLLKIIEIQHISTLVRQSNGTYKYQTVKKNNEVSSKAFEIAQGGYMFPIDTSSPGDYAVEIYDSENRRLSRAEYSVVGHSNLAGKLDKNAELQVKLNKSDYLPGELIEMNIRAPYKGAGLLSIETDSVHTFKWFTTDTASTIQTIQIPKELEGTAYVNVSFMRDVGSKAIFTSPLSYAVHPFSIDKSKRKIDITLKVEDIVRPGKPMKIGFNASKKSKIAVFAVDEGILQVAKYKVPNPLGHFLQKRSLGVETLQILDLILPEFDLLKTFSASGGGTQDQNRSLAKNLNPFSRKTDKPAVYWSGIHDAGPEYQNVMFDVPNTFAGALRVMAVAVSDDAMGVSSDSSIVRGPFVISPNVLTQTAPGDEFLVTVGVANIIDGSGENADIDVEVRASEHLQVVGATTTKLKINEGGEDKASFTVKATNTLGAAELVFTARHKNEESSRTASLSVRPAVPYYTGFESGFVDSGDMELASNRTLYTNLAKQSISASSSPLVLVDGLTSYLDTFPHGCTEQVVSKVFPLVGLMTHPAYAPHVPNVHERFSHLIDKLRQRQLADGGFAFWPGTQSTAEYPTIYVMHFLIESQELGYPVPVDMMRRGKDYLSFYVSRPATSLTEARNKAKAIYLLTRLGVVSTNYLVDLQEYLEKQLEKIWRKDLLASYMAATYKLLQKDSEATKLISGYKLGSKTAHTADDFHSALAQDAQYIFLLSKHFEDRAKALDGEDVLTLTDKIFKGEYNTISSAYSILALGAYSKLALNNEFNEDIAFSAVLENGQKNILQTALKPFLQANYPVDTQSIILDGSQSLYYLNIQSGFDTHLPEKPVKNGLEVYRDFLDDEGNKISSYTQGKEITVRLRVRALGSKTLTNIAVVDLLPGGFEVVRSSVSRTAFVWKADYIDVREDRVVYYGDFDNSVRDLIYKVKLTSAGDFVVPPSYAESMYDRSIRAVSKAGIFNVIAAK